MILKVNEVAQGVSIWASLFAIFQKLRLNMLNMLNMLKGYSTFVCVPGALEVHHLNQVVISNTKPIHL